MRTDLAPPGHTEIEIALENGFVQADLDLPHEPCGLVVFAHGSGSSRHSPRNVSVARELRSVGLGTLLLDLLTSSEEARDVRTREHRFDIPLLASRLVAATRWVRSQAALRALAIGYFGASTGSAAALVAAAELGDAVAAIVSRGGRPDLAGDALSRVAAATLLVVGGQDFGVIELNERAYGQLRCEKDFAIVAGATHLFEEPGALEQVCQLASHWFVRHLARHERRKG